MTKIAFLFFFANLLSLWLYPSVAPVLGIAFLLSILAIAISSIFKKHKQTENPRPKIVKDVLILVTTLLLIIFLGGLTGIFANYYASLRFGAVVGFVSAIVASFVVGYLVRWGVGKLGR
jgi:hypothetical protein